MVKLCGAALLLLLMSQHSVAAGCPWSTNDVLFAADLNNCFSNIIANSVTAGGAIGGIGTLGVKSTPGHAVSGYFEGDGSASALSSNALWTVYRSFGVTRAAVFDIQAINAAGIMKDQSASWNAGLQWWDTGNEQSAFDFGGYRNGALEVFLTLSAGCIGGVNTAANNAQAVGCPTTVPPNFSPVLDNTFTLGASFAKWKEVFTRDMTLSGSLIAAPVSFSGTGNLDLSKSGGNCDHDGLYTGATNGTLTVLTTATPGCRLSINATSTGLATIAAAAGGTIVGNTACTTNKRTKESHSVIVLRVESNPGSAPVINVSGDCG